MTPTYSKINPQELADMKEKYGPWLDEQEVLYLLRQERERGMREELFTRGSEPRRAGINSAALNAASAQVDVDTQGNPGYQLPMPTDPTKLRVTEEQIVQAAKFTDLWKLVAFILAFTVGWAWLLARWFR